MSTIIDPAVSYPKHYKILDTDAITLLAKTLTPEEFRGFCLGNILKYRLRAGKKDNASQDLAKALEFEKLFDQYYSPPGVPHPPPTASALQELEDAAWSIATGGLTTKYLTKAEFQAISGIQSISIELFERNYEPGYIRLIEEMADAIYSALLDAHFPKEV